MRDLLSIKVYLPSGWFARTWIHGFLEFQVLGEQIAQTLTVPGHVLLHDVPVGADDDLIGEGGINQLFLLLFRYL